MASRPFGLPSTPTSTFLNIAGLPCRCPLQPRSDSNTQASGLAPRRPPGFLLTQSAVDVDPTPLVCRHRPRSTTPRTQRAPTPAGQREPLTESAARTDNTVRAAGTHHPTDAGLANRARTRVSSVAQAPVGETVVLCRALRAPATALSRLRSAPPSDSTPKPRPLSSSAIPTTIPNSDTWPAM